MTRHLVTRHLAPLNKAAHALFQEQCSAMTSCTLFLSASDMRSRAVVRHSCALSLEKAWEACVQKVEKSLKSLLIRPTVWRVDGVMHSTAMTFAAFQEEVTKTRRNYYRYGLALDAAHAVAFTEQELNAHAVLYPGGDPPDGQVNEKNFLTFLKGRFPEKEPQIPKPEDTVYKLQTCGLYMDEQGVIHRLYTAGPETGRRVLEGVDAACIQGLIQSSTTYLTRQVKKNGKFEYGYFPCFDRKIATYNALRHVSTTYAMLEGWEMWATPATKRAIDRAMQYIRTTLLKTHILPDNTTAAFILDDVVGEYKLGASGVALVMYAKYTELTNDTSYIPVMEHLARGIIYMQDDVSGEFVHVLSAQDLSIKDKYRIVYYDGEAVFGLLRFYALHPQPYLLDHAVKAFESFIARDHWQHHDHWLGYSVNEITRYLPQEKYFRFGIQNVVDYLDFVLTRETTFPTLLEMMMATERMLTLLQDMPDMQHVLKELDTEKFYRALQHRAEYLLNGYFWPEWAMYYKKPENIVGSFFIRHHAFRVRIDDVEHYVSGLVAYGKYLSNKIHGRVLENQAGVLQSPLTSAGVTI